MLNDQELNKITGGKSKVSILVAIGAAVTFLFSVIDGYFRPLSCNK